MEEIEVVVNGRSLTIESRARLAGVVRAAVRSERARVQEESGTRLSPVCPVCGEDEPRMEVWKRNEKPLVCFCHRCGFQWDVEPLSKPWED